MSSLSAAAGFAAGAMDDCAGVAAATISGAVPPGSEFCATPTLLTSERAKTRTAICAINFRSTDFIRPPLYRSPANCLRVNSTLANRVGHAVNREHVSGNSVVDFVSLGVTHHVVKRRLHDGLELLVHDRLFPEVSLAILHPLEVRSGYAAGIGENVGNNEDAFVGEHIVRRGSGRPVRALGENAALYAIDVAAVDDVLGCRGDENFAIGSKQFRRVVFFGFGETMHRAVLLAEFDQSFQVDAVLVVEAATDFSDTDNFIARLVHQLRCVGADVAESLHNDAGAFAIDAELSASFVAHDHHAA